MIGLSCSEVYTQMTRLFGHTVRSELVLLYVIEALICFAVVYSILSYSGYATNGPVERYQAILFAAALSLCSGIVNGASGLYQPEGWQRAGRFVASTLMASVLLALPAKFVLAVVAPHADTWLHLAELLAGIIAVIVLTRVGYRLVLQSGWLVRRLAVVRGVEGPLSIEREFGSRARGEELFEIAAVVPQPAIGDAQVLHDKRVWGVIAAPGVSLGESASARLRASGFTVLGESEFLEQRLNRVDIERLAPGWLAEAMRRGGPVEAAIRRAVDVAGSLAILILTLPLLVLTAIAIRLDSAGPVLYRQERVGQAGRTFSLLKFRSMRPDAEAGGAPRWASRHDDRVTRVGRFIRLTRIDEIPQVINVLRGDMSLVGPRPERPVFVERLGQLIPHYHDRASVRPGITGWAQVNYPYGASVEDARMKLAYDLYYIRRRSLFLDLLILVATVRVILFQEGSR